MAIQDHNVNIKNIHGAPGIDLSLNIHTELEFLAGNNDKVKYNISYSFNLSDQFAYLNEGLVYEFYLGSKKISSVIIGNERGGDNRYTAGVLESGSFYVTNEDCYTYGYDIIVKGKCYAHVGPCFDPSDNISIVPYDAIITVINKNTIKDKGYKEKSDLVKIDLSQIELYDVSNKYINFRINNVIMPIFITQQEIDNGFTENEYGRYVVYFYDNVSKVSRYIRYDEIININDVTRLQLAIDNREEWALGYTQEMINDMQRLLSNSITYRVYKAYNATDSSDYIFINGNIFIETDRVYYLAKHDDSSNIINDPNLTLVDEDWKLNFRSSYIDSGVVKYNNYGVRPVYADIKLRASIYDSSSGDFVAPYDIRPQATQVSGYTVTKYKLQIFDQIEGLSLRNDNGTIYPIVSDNLDIYVLAELKSINIINSDEVGKIDNEHVYLDFNDIENDGLDPEVGDTYIELKHLYKLKGTNYPNKSGESYAQADTRCVFKSTGGFYYFIFNVETNKLIISREIPSGGAIVPSGDTTDYYLFGDFNGEHEDWTRTVFTRSRADGKYIICSKTLEDAVYYFRILNSDTWFATTEVITDTTDSYSNDGIELYSGNPNPYYYYAINDFNSGSSGSNEYGDYCNDLVKVRNYNHPSNTISKRGYGYSLKYLTKLLFILRDNYQQPSILDTISLKVRREVPDDIPNGNSNDDRIIYPGIFFTERKCTINISSSGIRYFIFNKTTKNLIVSTTIPSSLNISATQSQSTEYSISGDFNSWQQTRMYICTNPDYLIYSTNLQNGSTYKFRIIANYNCSYYSNMKTIDNTTNSIKLYSENGYSFRYSPIYSDIYLNYHIALINPYEIRSVSYPDIAKARDLIPLTINFSSTLYQNSSIEYEFNGIEIDYLVYSDSTYQNYEQRQKYIPLGGSSSYRVPNPDFSSNVINVLFSPYNDLGIGDGTDYEIRQITLYVDAKYGTGSYKDSITLESYYNYAQGGHRHYTYSKAVDTDRYIPKGTCIPAYLFTEDNFNLLKSYNKQDNTWVINATTGDPVYLSYTDELYYLNQGKSISADSLYTGLDKFIKTYINGNRTLYILFDGFRINHNYLEKALVNLDLCYKTTSGTELRYNILSSYNYSWNNHITEKYTVGATTKNKILYYIALDLSSVEGLDNFIISNNLDRKELYFKFYIDIVDGITNEVIYSNANDSSYCFSTEAHGQKIYISYAPVEKVIRVSDITVGAVSTGTTVDVDLVYDNTKISIEHYPSINVPISRDGNIMDSSIYSIYDNNGNIKNNSQLYSILNAVDHWEDLGITNSYIMCLYNNSNIVYRIVSNILDNTNKARFYIDVNNNYNMRILDAEFVPAYTYSGGSITGVTNNIGDAKPDYILIYDILDSSPYLRYPNNNSYWYLPILRSTVAIPGNYNNPPYSIYSTFFDKLYMNISNSDNTESISIENDLSNRIIVNHISDTENRSIRANSITNPRRYNQLLPFSHINNELNSAEISDSTFYIFMKTDTGLSKDIYYNINLRASIFIPYDIELYNNSSLYSNVSGDYTIKEIGEAEDEYFLYLANEINESISPENSYEASHIEDPSTSRYLVNYLVRGLTIFYPSMERLEIPMLKDTYIRAEDIYAIHNMIVKMYTAYTNNSFAFDNTNVYVDIDYSGQLETLTTYSNVNTARNQIIDFDRIGSLYDMIQDITDNYNNLYYGLTGNDLPDSIRFLNYNSEYYNRNLEQDNRTIVAAEDDVNISTISQLDLNSGFNYLRYVRNLALKLLN